VEWGWCSAAVVNCPLHNESDGMECESGQPSGLARLGLFIAGVTPNLGGVPAVLRH
jgi:hypothetical protein